MSLGSTNFAAPLFGLLALLLPAYIFWRMRALARGAVPFAPLQYRPPRGFAAVSPWALLLIEVLLLSVGIVALAAPFAESERETIREQGLDIALSLDVSASMMAADFQPNRLEVLKSMAANFVKRSGGDRIAVYIFAKDVFTQTPMTTDHGVLLELLQGISFKIIDHAKSGGTAMGDALLAAGEALLRNRIQGRDQVVLLFTDGESNYGVDPALAARFLRGNGIRFYVIGIGGDKEVPVYIDGKPFIAVGGRQLYTKLDDTQLKKITEAGGGRYFRARSEALLATVFADLARLERTPLEVRTIRTRRSFASNISAVAAVLFLAYFGLYGFYLRRPWL